MNVNLGKKENASDVAEHISKALNENLNVDDSSTINSVNLEKNEHGVIVERIEIPPIVLQKSGAKPKKVQLITTTTEDKKEKLKMIAKQENVSLNALLGAVYDALIAKYNI